MGMSKLFNRLAEPHLKLVLSESPVALIHGPRQCGKTTIAQKVGKQLGYVYISMDDDTNLQYAQNDPANFVRELPPKAILDEVQKAPKAFSQIKWLVDSKRTPGRLILTGSVSLFHTRDLTDSLAGRMGIIRMHPLAQAELSRIQPNFLDALFAGKFSTQRQVRTVDLAARIVSGGYPAALRYKTKHRRNNWYYDYLAAIANTDAFVVSRIRSVEDLPKLLELAAVATANLHNVNNLATSFRLTRPTIDSYITLLERLFLLERLPPWSGNHIKRLIKAPKLHIADTGLACALLRVDARTLIQNRKLLGQLLETFVFQELRRMADAVPQQRHQFFHYRDKDGVEVDLVIQRSVNAIAGVEVKAATAVSWSDFAGLRRLQAAVGSAFVCGVVLYHGTRIVRFGEQLYAVPVQTLWKKL